MTVVVASVAVVVASEVVVVVVGSVVVVVVVVLVVVVVGAALFIALGHDGLTIPNSAGGVFDDPFELAISETGIIVTYIVAAAAILVTIVGEVRNALK